MKLKFLLLAAFCAGMMTAAAQNHAQASKLSSLIPNLFGPNGLTLPSADHQAHFDSAFRSNFAPMNVAIGSQLSSLPLPAPASGFTYTFDETIGVQTRSTTSFGPILAERAETIGKDKFFAGFSFQRFYFDSLDGINLKQVPAVFEHLQTTPDPNFKKDIITTVNSIDLQTSQSIVFMTYGVTSRFDVSVAVPFVTTSLKVISNAAIQRIGTPGDSTVHYFKDANGNNTDRQQFTAAGDASGIGDVVLRFKANVFQSSRAGVALGADVRLPTGDEYDFLGSGAYGLRPWVALSARAGRISPHLNLGYQWNGSSVLAGDVGTGQRRRLPRQASYAAGFDAGINKKLTIAADLLGLYSFNADQVISQSFTASNGSRFPQVGFLRANTHVNSGAIGFKANPVSTLLVSFNLLFPINEQGLHSRIVPLLGLSYTF